MQSTWNSQGLCTLCTFLPPAQKHAPPNRRHHSGAENPSQNASRSPCLAARSDTLPKPSLRAPTRQSASLLPVLRANWVRDWPACITPKRISSGAPPKTLRGQRVKRSGSEVLPLASVLLPFGLSRLYRKEHRAEVGSTPATIRSSGIFVPLLI